MAYPLNAFEDIFDYQQKTQELLLKDGLYDAYCDGANEIELPCDKIELASYHIQQLVSEIGEVLDADKRWKNFRNEKYEPEAKLEELADVLIVVMNVAMFSGFSAVQLYDEVCSKLIDVRLRILENKEKEDEQQSELDLSSGSVL